MDSNTNVVDLSSPDTSSPSPSSCSTIQLNCDEEVDVEKSVIGDYHRHKNYAYFEPLNRLRSTSPFIDSPMQSRGRRQPLKSSKSSSTHSSRKGRQGNSKRQSSPVEVMEEQKKINFELAKKLSPISKYKDQLKKTKAKRNQRRKFSLIHGFTTDSKKNSHIYDYINIDQSYETSSFRAPLPPSHQPPSNSFQFCPNFYPDPQMCIVDNILLQPNISINQEAELQYQDIDTSYNEAQFSNSVYIDSNTSLQPMNSLPNMDIFLNSSNREQP